MNKVSVRGKNLGCGKFILNFLNKDDELCKIYVYNLIDVELKKY